MSAVCRVDEARRDLDRAERDWPMTEVAGIPVHRCCASDATFAVESAARLQVSASGVARWASNGQVPFDDMLDLMEGLEVLPAGVDRALCAAARAADLSWTLATYRAVDPEPSAEERFELAAAFGPGVEVVNVITGRRTTTGGSR